MNQYKLIYSLCYKFANINSLEIDPSGMRDESLNLVRSQRRQNLKMRPIVIDVYPNKKSFLSDGRHRLAVAKELGDSTIGAIIRHYDDEANVIYEEEKLLEI